MFRAHAADQALTLALGERDDQSRGVRRRLTRGEHDLWNAAPHEPAEVETRATAELLELKTSKLSQSLIL